MDRLSLVVSQSSDPRNPSPQEIRTIVQFTLTVAVVGISRDPSKAARRVPSYMGAKGALIIPVNPNADYIMGRAAAEHIDDVLDPVDMVLVFRPSDRAGAVVDAAAQRPENPVIWLQEGIRNDEAAERARAAGRRVVQDLCLYKVHRAITSSPS